VVLVISIWLVGLNTPSFLLFIRIFTYVLLGGIIIIPILGQQDCLHKVKRDLAKLKNKKKMFQVSLLPSGKPHDVYQGLEIIRKGERSIFQIIKVSNTFCSP